MDRMLWLLTYLLTAFLTLALAGLLYRVYGTWRDRSRFLKLGRLVTISPGKRLYIELQGSVDAPAPAVIFESGFAATSQNWHRLRNDVNGFARTLTYDRSGLGFSSPSRTDRTPTNIVRELRALLETAGVSPPYVLVGHSFGGLVMRRFAAEYPDDVASVLLLDPMRPEEWPPVNTKQTAHLQRAARLIGIAVPIAQLGLARLVVMSLLCGKAWIAGRMSRSAGRGGLHVADRVITEVTKMPRTVWPVIAAHWASPDFYRGMRAHLRGIPATVTEMHDAEPIQRIPIVLMTAASAGPLPEEGLRRIGTNVRQIVVEGSGHWVHLDRHDVVLSAIRQMVEAALAGAHEVSQASEYTMNR